MQRDTQLTRLSNQSLRCTIKNLSQLLFFLNIKTASYSGMFCVMFYWEKFNPNYPEVCRLILPAAVFLVAYIALHPNRVSCFEAFKGNSLFIIGIFSPKVECQLLVTVGFHENETGNTGTDTTVSYISSVIWTYNMRTMNLVLSLLC